VVKSKLDEIGCARSHSDGGIYLHLESGPNDAAVVHGRAFELKTAEIDARLSSRPIERYEWPLAGAIVALIAPCSSTTENVRKLPGVRR